MRDMFQAFYPPSEAEIDEAWESGLIVLDANVLLHFFRWPAAVRDSFFAVLESHAQRLWLPHQVALEFHRARDSVRTSQASTLRDAREALEKNLDTLAGSVANIRIHPTLDRDLLRGVVDDARARMQSILDGAAEGIRQADEEGHGDSILERLERLFDGRVGAPYATDDLKRHQAEAKRRRQEKIPPGYEDRGKEGEAFGDPDGDYLLWRQILDRAEADRVPVLFVTDDQKGDWWRLRGRSERVGPRPELVDEFHDATGTRLLMSTSDRFLRDAQRRINAVNEVSVRAAKEFAHDWERPELTPVPSLHDVFPAGLPRMTVDPALLRHLAPTVEQMQKLLAESVVSEAAKARWDAATARAFLSTLGHTFDRAGKRDALPADGADDIDQDDEDRPEDADEPGDD